MSVRWGVAVSCVGKWTCRWSAPWGDMWTSKTSPTHKLEVLAQHLASWQVKDTKISAYGWRHHTSCLCCQKQLKLQDQGISPIYQVWLMHHHLHVCAGIYPADWSVFHFFVWRGQNKDKAWSQKDQDWTKNVCYCMRSAWVELTRCNSCCILLPGCADSTPHCLNSCTCTHTCCQGSNCNTGHMHHTSYKSEQISINEKTNFLYFLGKQVVSCFGFDFFGSRMTYLSKPSIHLLRLSLILISSLFAFANCDLTFDIFFNRGGAYIWKSSQLPHLRDSFQLADMKSPIKRGMNAWCG